MKCAVTPETDHAWCLEESVLDECEIVIDVIIGLPCWYTHNDEQP